MDFGLGWHQSGARMYDPACGCFTSVDPLADEQQQESWTPYHYGFNNPIRYNDPTGRCVGCDFIQSGINFIHGLGNALASNATTVPGSNLSLVARGEGGAAYTAGQQVGDIASVVGGAIETAGGLLAAGGGAAITIGSLGTLSLAGAPAVAAGVGMAAHGTATMLNGAQNLLNPSDNKGRVYAKKSDQSKIEVADEDKIDRNLLNPPSKKGNAPTFKEDGKRVEIHHVNQNPNGPFKEMHPKDHRGKGNDKINHPNKSQPSKIDRKDFAKKVSAYWIKEFFK